MANGKSRKSSRPTKSQLAAAQNKRVRDVIAENLSVLFVGINPSLYSAAVGHHFARPGNRFWPTLYEARFTPRLFSPDEDQLLVECGGGITNLVSRATARADELDRDELRSGASSLKRKITKYKPRCVAFVGIGAYRTAFGCKDSQVGRQEMAMGNAAVWVLPNTSGLNAHYQIRDFKRLFSRLREFVTQDRNFEVR